MFCCSRGSGAGRGSGTAAAPPRRPAPRRQSENGGVFASLSTRISRASTSTSPVSSFGLTVSAERRCTRPVHGDHVLGSQPLGARPQGLAAFVAHDHLAITPARSRMSMKSTPPRSRTRCTQPSRTTSRPTSAGRRAPQVWVRVRSPRGSATSSFAARGCVPLAQHPHLTEHPSVGSPLSPNCRSRSCPARALTDAPSTCSSEGASGQAVSRARRGCREPRAAAPRSAGP